MIYQNIAIRKEISTIWILIIIFMFKSARLILIENINLTKKQQLYYVYFELELFLLFLSLYIWNYMDSFEYFDLISFIFSIFWIVNNKK